jgi:hypothetical protein
MFILDPNFSIPDPTFIHPGYQIRNLSIPDPGSASKNLSILTQQIVSKLSKIWCGLFIPYPGSRFLPIPDPGVKNAPDPGSGSATVH